MLSSSSVKAPDEAMSPVQEVLRGAERVVSFMGRSQYGPDGIGVAACGLAALNCARVVLGKERNGLQGEGLVKEMFRPETLDDVLRICQQWSDSSHLDVDDIRQVPIFQRTLTLLWSEYEKSGLDQFRLLLRRLKDASPRSTAAIITRPPEIVAVLNIKGIQTPDIFVVFDSHPREKHPHGAAFIFNTSLDATAVYLSQLLRFDARLLEDSSLQWQAQLLAHFSAHLFVYDDTMLASGEWLEAVMASSLDVLALRSRVSELESAKTAWESENERLQNEVEDLSIQLDSTRRELRRRATSTQVPPVQSGASTSYPPLRPPVTQLGARDQALQTANDFAEAVRLRSDVAANSRIQNGFNRPSRPPRAWGSSEAGPSSITLDRDGVHEQIHQAEQRSHTDHNDDYAIATQLHLKLEEEDRRIRAQFNALKAQEPVMFNCGICMEEESEQMVARVDPCGHSFCRDCTRSYIRSKLGEHRFPIFCPVCVTEAGRTEPGCLSNLLIQQIGLEEHEFQLFSELEMSSFSVLLHCRGCEDTVFVDKQEYQEAKIIVCPLPRCRYAWCKACSQAVEIGGPQHSCDGSSELNHLMQQQGWKTCPGCSTPIDKTAGCNHMTCISPGCNTHFCYICGEAIVRSVLRDEIRTALTAHYRRCRLFEDVPDRPRGRR